MTWMPEIIGHGYNDCVLRVEHRPLKEPHSKDELIEILDTLKDAGVDAWWHSVSAKGSYPLFPSKVLPYKKDVAVDYYPWLVEEAHKRDIVLMSWEYLNTAPLLMEEHPDWRVEYFKGPETVKEEKERHNHFACFNSPYGDLLKDFCVEVVNDIGFDGIWFDGCYLWGPADDGFRWTCCCERCAKKFKDETGMNIPEKVDWENPIFPAFLNWRYDFFMNYWNELSDCVRSKNKTALIAFNFFNRHYRGATSANKLARHKMDALIAGEGTVKTVQMQIKTLRAVSDNYPAEVWTSLHDGVKLSYPSRPNPEPESLVFYAQAAATAGGYASYGLGPVPGDCAGTLKNMAEALRPLKGNVGGKPVKMCGLLFSGMTKDFAHGVVAGESHFASKYKPAVDNVYGAGFMLDALHWPYEIILDNQLDELGDYQIVILPDVQCMTDDAFESLRKYVGNGGTLVALGECGVKTPDGKIRGSGVLDNLFGIKKRYDNWDYCILEPVQENLKTDGLPGAYMISGKARLLEVEDDVQIISRAQVDERIGKVAFHDKLTAGGEAERSEKISSVCDHGIAICEKRTGKGRAIYIAPAIGMDYSQNPNRRSREAFKRVIGKIDLPYKVDAPANVAVSAWEKDGRLIFHILNQPSSMLRMEGFGLALNPEDIAPTGPVEISLRKVFDKAESPYPHLAFDFEKSGKGSRIKIPILKQHAIVSLS